MPQPNSVREKLSMATSIARASSRIAGMKTTRDNGMRGVVTRFTNQANATNGKDPSNKAADMMKAELESTPAFSHGEYRLMNEGLVTKNSHSKITQAVPATR